MILEPGEHIDESVHLTECQLDMLALMRRENLEIENAISQAKAEITKALQSE